MSSLEQVGSGCLSSMQFPGDMSIYMWMDVLVEPVQHSYWQESVA